MRHRQEEIRAKGFSLAPRPRENDVVDFSKIRIGLKTVEDAVFELNAYKKVNSRLGDKSLVLRALTNHSYSDLREISNLFYETSGIYADVCRYFAYLYRYDWYIIPYVESENTKEEKVLTDFSKALNYFDNSYIAKTFGEIALKVIRNGCYYGYVIEGDHRFAIQELPIEYCRSRYTIDGMPAIEFNMRYFDDKFTDVNYRMRVLKMFPKEFAEGYIAYKKNRLAPDYQGDSAGWYLLTPGLAFKFSCGDSDTPILANAIPAIIDLGDAQGIDRQRMMQQLLKILIQKLPIDKNGDLVFDVDEAADIHNNAVSMLRRAVGVDVLTTFADIEVADMSDNRSTAANDDLDRVERTVYNEFGVSRNIFNSESNLALKYSVLNDESSIRNLQQQFEVLLNVIIRRFNKNSKKYYFKIRLLETTIYNYQELSKLYKEQTAMGYSKMLPQIALGHSQSEILATINFENNILHLTELMIPPLMSSTMSGSDILGKVNQNNQSENQNNVEEKTNGRPTKDDTEKSDKTIANQESM